MMKRPIVAANWKMYKTPAEAKEFMRTFIADLPKDHAGQFLIFPPAIGLTTVGEQLAGTQVGWGAQNIYYEKEGAFTGENSPAVVKAIGATHCLVGHSERRKIFDESDEMIGRKVHAAQVNGLTPILCIGETLQERENDETKLVLLRQLQADLFLCDWKKDLMIAYEPVWAIGTGKVATPEQAEEAHLLIRQWLTSKVGQQRADQVPILYGGSVKPDNARELSQRKSIDGFLVGGASLKPESFLGIFRNCL